MIRKALLLGAGLLLIVPAAAAPPRTALSDDSARVIHISSSGTAMHQSITLGAGKSLVVELDSEAHDVLVETRCAGVVALIPQAAADADVYVARGVEVDRCAGSDSDRCGVADRDVVAADECDSPV